MLIVLDIISKIFIFLRKYFYIQYSVQIFLLCLVFIAFKLQFQKKTTLKSVTDKIPTKFGLPFIGIGYQFLPTKKFLYAIGDNFKKLKCTTYCAWLGMDPFIITVNPDNVKKVLTSEEFLVKAHTIYTALDNALPNGIMTSGDEKWRHNRRLLNFSFSHGILRRLMPIFNKHTNELVYQMTELVDSKEHHIFVLIKRIVMQTSLETTMGIELKTENKIDEKLANGFNYMLQQVAKELLYSTVQLGFLAHTPKYYSTIKFLKDYAANIIKNKYVGIQREMSPKEKMNDGFDKVEHEIFIKQAIAYQKKGLFEFDDIINETHTMIAGTFDTVSTSIFSIIVLLAMHQDVQEKLFKDILALLPDKRAEIDYEIIKQSPYMDMVIDESLRLMPSIPVIARESAVDINIEDDVLLPKGIQVMIPIFTLHRCKDIWGPNANDFNPENFAADKINERHPFAYIPFSKGARNCLGMRYAYIALRVLLLKLVRNYQFSTSFKYEDLVFLNNISLRYDQEPKIKIKRRSI